jgi:hypothetical protein
MVPTDSFSDRLARLTYLCSEISKVAKGKRVPTERLRDILKEAEDLCRAVRREIARRQARDDR